MVGKIDLNPQKDNFMQKTKNTTNLTINATTTKNGADKVALTQATLQGIAQIILAIGQALKPFRYQLIWLIVYLSV